MFYCSYVTHTNEPMIFLFSPTTPRQIIHRDIKLENILLGSNKQIKIIDFGLCSTWSPDTKLRVHCGSPSYAAPEIVSRKSYRGPPVDVWSLGIVLFAMVSGYLPFHVKNGNKQELCAKIIKGSFNIPEHITPVSFIFFRLQKCHKTAFWKDCDAFWSQPYCCSIFLSVVIIST